MPRTEQSFGFVVVHPAPAGNRFLLVRQLTNWSFPKGHPEGSETPLETAGRELLEECGLSENDISIVAGISFEEGPYAFLRNGAETEKTNTFFLAHTSSEHIRPQPIEILECRFASYDEALGLFTYEGQKRVLEDAQKYLLDNPI